LRADAHAVLIVLAAELAAMQTLIASIEKRIMAQHRKSDASQGAGDHSGDWLRRGDRERRHGHGPEGIPVGA
jgi:hypothetical protein